MTWSIADDDEYVSIEEAAQLCGMDVSTFVAIMAMDGLIGGTPESITILRPDVVKRISDPPSTMSNN